MSSAPCFRLTMILLTVWSGSARASEAVSHDCAANVLAELGWRIETAEKTRTDAGAACAVGGDLHLAMGADFDPRAFLYGRENRCAYGRLLQTATRTAMKKLIANPRFAFQAPTGAFMELPGSWKKFGPRWDLRTGRMVARPRDDVSKAVEDFYTKPIRAECHTGREILEIAAQYELHGREGFARAFEPKDLQIGAPLFLFGLGGSLMYQMEDHLDLDPRPFVESGPYAWIGLSGRINSVFDRSFLDSPVDAGENFVLTSVSDEAHRILLADTRGPISTLGRMARTIWEKSRILESPEGRRALLTLLNSVERGKPELASEAWAKVTAEEKDALLSLFESFRSPVLTQITVYVHPLAERNFGQHLARLLRKNPRTPYDFKLFNMQGSERFFRRFVDQRIEAVCGSGGRGD